MLGKMPSVYISCKCVPSWMCICKAPLANGFSLEVHLVDFKSMWLWHLALPQVLASELASHGN
jgi:hypothetical protein